MALKITRARRLVEVITDGDKLAAWEAADAAYKRAVAEEREESKASVKDDRMSGRGGSAAQRVKELRAEAEKISAAAADSKVVFRVEALSRVKWDEITAEFPVAVSDSEPLPYDTKKVTDAVMSVPGAIVSVEYLVSGEKVDFTHEDWQEFSDTLSKTQHDDFLTTIVQLNAGTNEVPFLPASVTIQDSVKS